MTAKRISTNARCRQPGSALHAQTPLQTECVVKRNKRPIPSPSVGSGFVVICRDAETGVLKRFGRRPYEHPTEQEALSEATRLAEKHGHDFGVFRQIANAPAPENFQPSMEIRTSSNAKPECSPAAPDATKPVRRPVVVERRISRHLKVGRQS